MRAFSRARAFLKAVGLTLPADPREERTPDAPRSLPTPLEEPARPKGLDGPLKSSGRAGSGSLESSG